jgi:hypothetical protein
LKIIKTEFIVLNAKYGLTETIEYAVFVVVIYCGYTHDTNLIKKH